MGTLYRAQEKRQKARRSQDERFKIPYNREDPFVLLPFREQGCGNLQNVAHEVGKGSKHGFVTGRPNARANRPK